MTALLYALHIHKTLCSQLLDVMAWQGKGEIRNRRGKEGRVVEGGGGGGKKGVLYMSCL